MSTPLTLERIAEIEALFVQQRDADEALHAASNAIVARPHWSPAYEGLVEKADAAANAINDAIDPADILTLIALARQALEG
ncbi:50S ribosomal protein L10 domain protein, partial [Acetobacteraceae bacterium AT-5844]